MRARVAVGALVATLALLALPPAIAGACNYPEFGLSKKSFGPGDTSGFTITDLEAGGEYRLTVEGHVVASGISTSEAGHSGTTAPMPDLGRSRSVSVELYAIHEGAVEPGHENGPWTRSVSVEFVAAAGAPAAPAQPAAAQPASPQPQPQSRQAPAPPAPPAAPAAAATPERPAGSRAATVARPNANARIASGRVAPTPARGVGASRAVTPAAVTAAPDVAPPAAAGATQAATPARSTPRTARTATAARPRALPAPRASAWSGSPAAAADDGPALPSTALLALVLGLLAHGAAVLVRLLRRVPAAQPADSAELDDLGIERELQEMIAAERAKMTA